MKFFRKLREIFFLIIEIFLKTMCNFSENCVEMFLKNYAQFSEKFSETFLKLNELSLETK